MKRTRQLNEPFREWAEKQFPPSAQPSLWNKNYILTIPPDRFLLCSGTYSVGYEDMNGLGLPCISFPPSSFVWIVVLCFLPYIYSLCKWIKICFYYQNNVCIFVAKLLVFYKDYIYYNGCGRERMCTLSTRIPLILYSIRFKVTPGRHGAPYHQTTSEEKEETSYRICYRIIGNLYVQ